MTAKEIFNILLSEAGCIRESTCDGLVSGDEDKVVKKAATCFKLTAELIERAADANVDLIITHEPTFSQGDLRENAKAFDIKKWELLDKSGITLYRFHDHAHLSEPDYIHEGFIRSVGLKIKHRFERESLGVSRYDLDENLTVKELAKRIQNRLGVEFVRIVGSDDHVLKTVGLGLGGVGLAQINILFDPGCDVFITGETGEVLAAEYVRDACYFGERKAVILLGHFSSEYAGMRLLAETMNERIVPTVFLNGCEVYHGI